jgi:hypothetical protein
MALAQITTLDFDDKQREGWGSGSRGRGSNYRYDGEELRLWT